MIQKSVVKKSSFTGEKSYLPTRALNLKRNLKRKAMDTFEEVKKMKTIKKKNFQIKCNNI